MEGVPGHPFGVNKARAEQILTHEARTGLAQHRAGKENTHLFWMSVLAKYNLTIIIDSAENLAKKDLFGLSDPYVKMSFRGDRLRVFPHFTTLSSNPIPEFYKTKVIPKSLNPKWNSSFHFTVSGTEGTIIFDCYDENVLIPDDFLGRVYFTFNLTNPDSPDYVPVQPASGPVGEHFQAYVLEEKYQNEAIERIPYLRDLKVSGKKSRKNHKIKGKLKMLIKFKERNRWEDLIESVGPYFGLQQASSTEDPADQFESITLESAGPSNDNDSDEFEELPAGWERRLDSNRRPVYVHHDTRVVSLQRPQIENEEDSLTRRNFLPRLHSVDEEQVDEDGWILVDSAVASTTAGSSITTTNTTTTTTTNATIATATVTSQALPTNQTSQTTQAAASTVTPSEEIPHGWERRLTNEGKAFYMDHNTRSTSWSLPSKKTSKKMELVASTTSIQAQEQDDSLPPGWETRRTADGKIFFIDHNTRTTSWAHPGKSEIPLPLGWEAREHSDGRIFYIDHNTKSTQWVDPRLELKNKPTAKIEYDRNYRQKYINFRTTLKQKPNMPKEFRWQVSRSRLLEDSFNAIMSVKDTQLLKSRLYVTFEGESGLDYGGLAREWFYLLSHEMFNPYYGLFEYSASDDYTLQINPDSGLCNENHIQYFKFVGRVCGMAVYHAKLVDAFFIRPFYKMMLRKKIVLKDMECVDVEFHNSLKYLLDNDPEPLSLNFTATKDHFGEVTEVELKRGGGDIVVTESNRKEYVELMLKWRFKDRINAQMNAFLDGFSKLVPLNLIKVFDEKELEYLMGGLAEIDVEDWKKNTNYLEYAATAQPIVWFWKAVETFDNETRARLLQFVTGTSKVPMNGFSELQGSNGPKKFTIKKFGAVDSLPCAHTCFNRMDLPPYKSYYDLKEKLKLAVDNTEGFEIE